MTDETLNAKIEETFLGVQGHGIFTCVITFGGAGWSQGFPAYNLQTDASKFLLPLIKTVGAKSYEDLTGHLVRVKRDNGIIVAVGHIFDDKWFTPADVMK